MDWIDDFTELEIGVYIRVSQASESEVAKGRFESNCAITFRSKSTSDFSGWNRYIPSICTRLTVIVRGRLGQSLIYKLEDRSSCLFRMATLQLVCLECI